MNSSDVCEHGVLKILNCQRCLLSKDKEFVKRLISDGGMDPRAKADMEASEKARRLTFHKLSEVNLSRCMRWHPGGIGSWSLSDWAVALAGEVGEACDVIKKLNRARDGLVGNKASPIELMAGLSKELADVQLYLDLLARAAGVDLEQAVRDKFNEVSERNGFPERL